MSRPDYSEVSCTTALNRVSGMPFRWSLNPYRGCVHACHYCYARATHRYLGFNASEDFETKIIVKVNMPEVLRQELGKRSWMRERVAIGTATDAYQPCEGRYRLTRRCLDEELSRLIEPGTPPPLKRLEVLRRLANAGVPCGVFLAPILPGITDSIKSIEAVAAAAKAHGAVMFGSSVLRLAPLVKAHYFGFVETHFSDLLPRYERAYKGTNISVEYQLAIERRIGQIRERHGFRDDAMAMHDQRLDAGTVMSRATTLSVNAGQLPLPL